MGSYALDLMKQVVNLNNGIYLEEDIRDGFRTKFSIGVAGYPEKHFEAPNMDSDIQHLKTKLDAGADYIVTQMFFDNAKFFDFVKKCREAGIEDPYTRLSYHRIKNFCYIALSWRIQLTPWNPEVQNRCGR